MSEQKQPSGDPTGEALAKRSRRCCEAFQAASEVHGPTHVITLVCAEAMNLALADLRLGPGRMSERRQPSEAAPCRCVAVEGYGFDRTQCRADEHGVAGSCPQGCERSSTKCYCAGFDPPQSGPSKVSS